MLIYIPAILVVFLACIVIAKNYLRIRALPGYIPDDMLELATIIRNGANLFMKREYRVIVPVTLFIAALYALFIDRWSFVTFLLGVCMSSATCVLGMKGATYANVLTADTARFTSSIGKTVTVAIRGGSISGLSVHAFGLLGVVLVAIMNYDAILHPVQSGHGFILGVLCNPAVTRLTTYSLGCSVVAMFNRVAGGNYTKAADISADIVAKNRHNMPEDDSRMPNTVADFIGDCVNDIAGNCSDLLESFVATIVSSILVAINLSQSDSIATVELLRATVNYPILLAGSGLLSCIIGIVYATMHRSSDKADQEINMVTYIAAGLTVLFGALLASFTFSGIELYASFRFGWLSPWISSVLGIATGVIIGKLTELYTGSRCPSVRQIARFAIEGTAFAATKGDAVGDRSCPPPIIVIVASLMASYGVCGIYGIAISALGMLSFVGATVTIDAFGPIADNAGGIAESCHLRPEVRAITDELDALGNTTAAIGKGLAIGSAAFATLSLMVAYVGSYSNTTHPVLNIIDVAVISGGMLGAALVSYFSALLTDNTIDSAYLMAEEGDRQLSIPGVIEGTVRPDYEKVISMAANEALKKMLKPSIIAVAVPAISGLCFGPEFVGGILVGATLTAIPKAIYMGNSGGAFDNAKKYIEAGMLEGHGKGSSAHKAAVACDTIGDTRKDVVGVALDIFIKTMSTVANTLAPVFLSVRLF